MGKKKKSGDGTPDRLAAAKAKAAEKLQQQKQEETAREAREAASAATVQPTDDPPAAAAEAAPTTASPPSPEKVDPFEVFEKQSLAAQPTAPVPPAPAAPEPSPGGGESLVGLELQETRMVKLELDRVVGAHCWRLVMARHAAHELRATRGHVECKRGERQCEQQEHGELCGRRSTGDALSGSSDARKS